MKIVFAITMGIERPSGYRYFNIARELAKQGHKVRIIALHPDLSSCLTRRFTSDDVEVWYVGQMYARKSHGTSQSFGLLQLLTVLVSATWGMFWALLCSPATVYHLGKPHPVNGLAGILAVKLRGKKLYLDCDDDEIGSNRLTNRFQQWVFGFWQWLLPYLVDGVTVNTRFLERRMKDRGINHVICVPNGVDKNLFRRPNPVIVAALKQSIGIEDKNVVAYVGTITFHNHPVDLLLEAFKNYVHTNPSAVLLLIGNGEDLPIVKQWIIDNQLHHNVICLGYVSRQSLPVLMSLADVTVDPVYDNDTARARSPLKIIESLALGIPVITGDVGDRQEMIGECGIVVSPNNSKNITNALSTIFHHKNTTCSVVDYEWSILAKKWIGIYE